MAGGKGRGIAAFSFNIESLGLSRGNMPQTRVGPNKLYPDVEFKPVPLKVGEDEDYMLALKQEIRGTMRQLPHNIRPLAGKGDWQLFPKELMPQKKKLNVKPGAKKKPIKVSSKEKSDVLSKLDELEKKDDVKSDEEKEEKKSTEEGEEEEIEGEELDEEELEEENDYIASYFEDGDDFGAGSDENMDEGATY
ncbi:DNA-directed RNA polymerase III subunit RPC7 isoform X2 [Coregonus clupeaformis]|uniref:DNA-directed RNA polymerase III subunit RPC7 isoform X2 n=1 Tax=Coregonus clupeaformis TaxID=59861 RepID=UPI001BE0BCC9|nr:DNA-directed RNA polymerase III subunit RPC7 isoform X2 [Coregonus clupeaformis]